jgi:hypothetical protein
MSVQALGWVFSHSTTTGADRLVLLSIANHAGHDEVDGETVWEAWPSIALIQREAGLSRAQTVRDCLNRLIDGGHLTREVQGAPDDRIRADRRSNLYRILVSDGVTSHGTPSDGTPSADGPTPHVERPHVSRSTAPRETRAEPSLNTSLKPSSESASTPSSLPVPSRPVPKGVNPVDVERLCQRLALRVARHRGTAPKITPAWSADMGTLLNSGAAGWDGPPPTPEQVAGVIDAVFDRLNVRSSRGFCWADQVRSPQGLRGKWEQLTFALREHQQAHPEAADVLAAMDMLDKMGVKR